MSLWGVEKNYGLVLTWKKCSTVSNQDSQGMASTDRYSSQEEFG